MTTNRFYNNRFLAGDERCVVVHAEDYPLGRDGWWVKRKGQPWRFEPCPVPRPDWATEASTR